MQKKKPVAWKQEKNQPFGKQNKTLATQKQIENKKLSIQKYEECKQAYVETENWPYEKEKKISHMKTEKNQLFRKEKKKLATQIQIAHKKLIIWKCEECK